MSVCCFLSVHVFTSLIHEITTHGTCNTIHLSFLDTRCTCAITDGCLFEHNQSKGQDSSLAEVCCSFADVHCEFDMFMVTI